MLVCWEWLSQYVDIDVSPDELANRFAMSGLNHESTANVDSDIVIDLEVTSNRGDCLSHIGVAREASVLLGKPLRIPNPQPPQNSQSTAAQFIRVVNEMGSGCSSYTARVIRGVRVGSSPPWLVRRLAAVGIKSVNNVVDVTNYVMLECGQPLHAFDLDKILGGKIIVRPGRKQEQFLAIDHRTYTLDEQMIVIADGQRAIGLGGVMGGADSEVSPRTSNLLIEAAAFDAMSIRRTARALKLHSPSSFRFERKPDWTGLDWASCRCCELILQVAGGQLSSGVEVATGDAGHMPGSVASSQQAPIEFRLDQIVRVLGIEISASRVEDILVALGCVIEGREAAGLRVIPPTWRADLDREIDLIEEVARIHGYDKIPENVAVPMSIAPARAKDLAIARIRHVLSALGVDEAMTPSLSSPALDDCGSLWTDRPALTSETPLLEGARILRRGLIPSLLAARHLNQTLAIRDAQLYEIATIYLAPQDGVLLPIEKSILAAVTIGDLAIVKGIVEEVVSQVTGRNSPLVTEQFEHPSLDKASGLRYLLGQQILAYVGLVSPAIAKRLGLDEATAVLEISLDTLISQFEEVRRATPISPYPSVARDLNFILSETVLWSELQSTCSKAGGSDLRAIDYCETYRDVKKDGPGKKRILVKFHFQSLQRTLTGTEVDLAVRRIIEGCASQFDAKIVDA